MEGRSGRIRVYDHPQLHKKGRGQPGLHERDPVIESNYFARKCNEVRLVLVSYQIIIFCHSFSFHLPFVLSMVESPTSWLTWLKTHHRDLCRVMATGRVVGSFRASKQQGKQHDWEVFHSKFPFIKQMRKYTKNNA